MELVKAVFGPVFGNLWNVSLVPCNGVSRTAVWEPLDFPVLEVCATEISSSCSVFYVSYGSVNEKCVIHSFFQQSHLFVMSSSTYQTHLALGRFIRSFPLNYDSRCPYRYIGIILLFWKNKDAYEIIMLSVRLCIPLIFSFSVRSMSYQKKESRRLASQNFLFYLIRPFSAFLFQLY
jgi:hypothetical protein